MRKETKTIAEYKAPKCKCVELHVSQALLNSSLEGNSINNWVEDEDELDC